MGRTLTARMPFPRGSSSTSNSTTWPSWSDCTPVGCRALTCTNTSSPCSGAIKPYPRSRLNHFTVPTIAVLSLSLAAARHPTTDARRNAGQLACFAEDDDRVSDRHGRLGPGAMVGAFELVAAHLAFHRAWVGTQPPLGDPLGEDLGDRPPGGSGDLVRGKTPRGSPGDGARSARAHKRQPVGVHALVQGGLVHQLADRVVDQQVRPDLLLHALGMLGAQHHLRAALVGLQLIQRALDL